MLQLAVPGGLPGMGAQEIPQVDVIAMGLTAGHHEVQVVVDDTRGRQERLPAGDAEAAQQLEQVWPPRVMGHDRRSVHAVILP